MSIDALVEGVCGEDTDPCPPLPRRDSVGHKGTFGTVLVIGGSMQLPRVMLGGAVIAARSALRGGAGLVQLAVPEPLIATALAALESATGQALPVDGTGDLDPSGCAAVLDEAAEGASAIVIGPALGGGEAIEQVVIRLVSHAQAPLVVDADALNALSRVRGFDRELGRAPVIMTPHPGEYARLAASLHLDPATALDDETRAAGARALARRLGCIVVLKGARTVVSDGVRNWSAHAGTAALATGGSGDALAGLCGSFIAQFSHAPNNLAIFDCARLAVAVHGLASRAWSARVGDAGMLASELCEEIPGVLASLRR